MTGTASRAHRNTIFLEDADVVSHEAHPGEQFVLRVHAPECAQRAVPGSFAHIRCDADIPMRRPLSIMRADAKRGTVDFLYKIVGQGLGALSRVRAGDSLSLLGPIGNGFRVSSKRTTKLMLGGGVGIPPMIFLAEHLYRANPDAEQLVLMGSEVPFPFREIESKVTVPGMPATASHGIDDLERIGIASRLASLQQYPGVFDGYITDLARAWLTTLSNAERSQVEVFACGPEPMLEAAARLVTEFDLPCQLCLEEFMACAVGGCAGCTVPVHLPDGIAMKRVCVDGPVFASDTIYPH